MKTNPINAPLTYKESAPAINPRFTAPELRKELDTARHKPAHGEPVKPRFIRAYVCGYCRRRGTLKNIGTHKEPRYIHQPPCEAMKKLEKKAAGGKSA